MPTSKFSADSLPSLKGKVYLVTGGNAGIGFHTVAGLAGKGAKVFMAARSESKALDAIKTIKADLPDAAIEFLPLDLTSLASVVAAAKTLRSKTPVLHGLINNAGVMGLPLSITEDGYEVQFQTNYLSHWLLTHHLLPLLRATAARSSSPGDVRVVNVTSDGHALFAPKGGIDFDNISLPDASPMNRYGQSKLANILHVRELHRRYGPPSKESPPSAGDKGETGEIWTAAVHPGHIDTNLNRQATGAAPAAALRFFASVGRCVGILDAQHKGAISSLFAVASADFTRGNSGAYIVPYAKFGTPSEYALDPALASRLWEWTVEELGKKGLLTIE